MSTPHSPHKHWLAAILSKPFHEINRATDRNPPNTGKSNMKAHSFQQKMWSLETGWRLVFNYESLFQKTGLLRQVVSKGLLR